MNRRRDEYEEKVAANPYDYDAWFDYLRLEETEGMDHEKTRGWSDVFLYILYMLSSHEKFLFFPPELRKVKGMIVFLRFACNL